MKLIKDHSSSDFLKLLARDAEILNAGSAGQRFGEHCLNVDIKLKPGVDMECDIHALPVEFANRFDAIVCVAVLQYCREPQAVANELFRTLKPGGLLYVDAPFVQPYCPDTPDLWRFTQEGLRLIFERAGFELMESGPSIRPGSAFSMLGCYIAGSTSGNRYVDAGLRIGAEGALWLFKWIRTADPTRTAGAHYLIAKKPKLD